MAVPVSKSFIFVSDTYVSLSIAAHKKGFRYLMSAVVEVNVFRTDYTLSCCIENGN